MGGRYWISGVQLGMLKAWMESYDHPDYANDILTQIDNNQFLGDTGLDESKKVVLFNEKTKRILTK